MLNSIVLRNCAEIQVLHYQLHTPRKRTTLSYARNLLGYTLLHKIERDAGRTNTVNIRNIAWITVLNLDCTPWQSLSLPRVTEEDLYENLPPVHIAVMRTRQYSEKAVLHFTSTQNHPTVYNLNAHSGQEQKILEKHLYWCLLNCSSWPMVRFNWNYHTQNNMNHMFTIGRFVILYRYIVSNHFNWAHIVRISLRMHMENMEPSDSLSAFWRSSWTN